MVDVSPRPWTAREAVARGQIRIAPRAMQLVRAGRLAKGSVEEVARLAGIMAAKRTAEADSALPLPLRLTHVDVDLYRRRDGFEIEGPRQRRRLRRARRWEALPCGVCVAALTIYDMVKGASIEA